MPVTTVEIPSGKFLDIEAPEGASEQDILSYAAQQFNADSSIGYEPEDDTTFLGSVGEFGKRALGGVATGAVSTVTGLGQLIPGVDDEAMLSADQSFRESVAETLGYDPAYDENYGAQLGQVVGEMAPMVASAFLPGGALGIAARVGAVTGPALSEGGFDRAEFESRTGEELSDYERLASKGADVALGQLERFGIPARILKGLPKGFFATNNVIGQRIQSMIAGGLREGVQEVGQGIARDISTLTIYDPDRKIADSAIDDFTLGGGAGAIYDLAIGLAQTPLRGKRNKAPKPLGEMTEEEVEREKELRSNLEQRQADARAERDRKTAEAESAQAEDAVVADPFDTKLLDSSLPADEMAREIILRSEAIEDYAPYLEEGVLEAEEVAQGIPAKEAFSTQERDGMFYVEQGGIQYGPLMQDPIKANDVMIRLNEYAANLRKQAGVEYAVDQIQYPETETQSLVIPESEIVGPRNQVGGITNTPTPYGDPDVYVQGAAQNLRESVIQFGNAIPSPDERIISVEEAEAAVPGISTKVNKLRDKDGKSPITVDGPLTQFTLNELRRANRGDIGALGDILLAKEADALAFQRGDQPPAATQPPINPMRPNQPALGRQRGIQQFNKSFDSEINSDYAFRQLLDIKMIDGGTDSQAFRGLIKRILGKTPSKESPLDSLTPSERRYLYHRIRQLPSFRSAGQAAPVTLPDFSVKTPQAELVQKARQAIRAGESPQQAVEREQFRRSGSLPSAAEQQRATSQAQRTAEPVERGGEPVPEGQQIVPFDIDQSALGQQLRDALVSFGINDVWATKMVDRVGKSARDSQGNIYVDPVEDADGNTTTEGQASRISQVIQVGLDGVMRDVKDGISYEEATSKIMNHEVIHAIRSMDLLTPAEWSLLERLTRTYKKEKENVTYGQWASSLYKDRSAVTIQEEAIAEMLSDALTGRVIIGNKVGKPSGKPASLIKKLVNFFKKLVGFAENNDVQSFSDLVNKLQTGEVGARERGVVRTPFRTELEQGTERFTREELRGETGQRGLMSEEEADRATRVERDERPSNQTLSDAPIVGDIDEEAVESRRARAEEQGFDTSTVYYHGTGVRNRAIYKPGDGPKLRNLETQSDIDRKRIFQDPPIKKFDPALRAEEHISMPLAFGLVAGHFSSSAKFVERFAKMDPLGTMRRNPDRPSAAIYPVYLRFGEDNSNLGGSPGLFAYYEAGADGAIQPIVDSVQAPLSGQPGLLNDLMNYYKLEIDQVLRNPNAPIKAMGMGGSKILGQVREGSLSVDAAARQLAEIYHTKQMPVTLETLEEEPEAVSFSELEMLAPYIKEAGFAGYRDIEIEGQRYSGIAMFNPADIKGVYAEFDPSAVPEGAAYDDDIMYSRRAKPAEVDVVDIMSGAEQAPKMKLKKEVATFLQNRTLDRTGAPRSFAIEEDREAIATDLAKEAVYEYSRADSAVEWYDQTIANTLEMLSVLYPEIKKDKGSRAMFFASLAITSQNLAVPDNLALAEKSYKHYKENGRFKVQGSGDKKKSMEANFKKLNMLIEQMSPAEIADFLEAKFIVRDLDKLSAQLLGKKADTGELVDNEVYGSAIFGPKIGNGFYSNLRGDFSPITMDMWFMRTMGRLSGTLIGVSPNSVRKSEERFAKAIGKKRIYADKLLEEARKVKSAHERMYKNMTAAEKKTFKKPEKTLAAENLIKKIDLTNDEPRNGSERNYLRDITRRAMAKFEEATGVSIEPAAFQALIWYPEQDLYQSLGVNLSHVRQDYATATEQHLIRLGVDPGKIKRAKDRVRRSAERRAESVRPDSRGDVGRADTASDIGASETVSSKRSVASQQQVEQAVQANLDQIDTTQGPPRFSVKASPEAQYIGQNPEAAIEPNDDLDILENRRPLSAGQSSTIDRLTTNKYPEAANGKVFMESVNVGPLGEMLTRFKAMAINRYAALEKYYQRVPGLRQLEADSSAIAAALFSDRAKGILASAVKYGAPVYENGLTKVVEFYHNGKQYNGLIDVMSLVYNKEDGDLRKLAQSYAMVKRSEVLRRQGKQTPVTEADAVEIEAAVNAYNRPDGTNPIREWHQVWTAYNDKTINFLKATGILNEETADQWKDSAYVPFYRGAESGGEKLPKVVSGVFGNMTRKSEFKKYVGSEKGVDIGLVESATLNLSAAIEMGMRNVAQQRITRDMQAMGLARQIAPNAKGTNAIKFKVNGESVQFEIADNLIYDSMETLGGGVATEIMQKYLGKPSNFLREMITRDPGFMIANLMRDTLSTFTTSGSNFIPGVDSVLGLFDGIERLEKTGVVGGYDFSIDQANILDFYGKESKRRGLGPDGVRGGPIGMFTSIWDALGRATTASDAATRNAVYNDVLARTGNEAEAAFQAMEIINFSRRGAHPLARVLTAAIPFLNARFQGLDVFVRSMSGNYSTQKQDSSGAISAKFLARGSLLMGLTALYWAMVSGEDWYEEQSEEVRDNNWLINTSAGVPLRIPIPFEVGLLFKVVPETVLATTMGDKSAREAFLTAKRGVVSTLEINVLGVQAFAPLVEASMNHNFFTQRPIVPYYIDTKIEGGLQDSEGTTEMAKFIGKSLNISPFKIDHVMSGYTGTLGGYVIALADRALKSETVKGEDAILPPSKNMFEFPLWRRFFAYKEGSGLKQDAYELYNEVSMAVNTINKLKRENRQEEALSFIASREHILQLKPTVYRVKKYLDDAREYKRKVISSDLDPDVKRTMIDDLDAQVNEYLKIMPALKEAANMPAIKALSSMSLLAQ